MAVGQPPRGGKKPRVRDHAMLRADTHPLDVPIAHKRFRGLDAGESFVGTQSIDETLDLQNRG